MLSANKSSRSSNFDQYSLRIYQCPPCDQRLNHARHIPDTVLSTVNCPVIRLSTSIAQIASITFICAGCFDVSEIKTAEAVQVSWWEKYDPCRRLSQPHTSRFYESLNCVGRALHPNCTQPTWQSSDRANFNV